MRKKTETVAFRADRELLRAIDEQRDHFQISRGAWVRGIVTTWLNQIHLESQTQSNSEVLESILDRLDQVTRNQAKSLYLQLIRIGNLPGDEAKSLIHKHLMNERE